MFVEKYRPKSFSEIKGQEKIIPRIKAFIESSSMPHLLFTGPAGVGKTTLSLIIANELFKEDRNHNFLELNASDERGIDVIRNKVKDFARTKSIKDIPFKVIYLDECDSLTKEAQQALRRTMENYSNSCRFILSCNYSSKIIDPIQSRCSVFRFKSLTLENMKEIVKKISEKEELKVSEDAVEALYELSNGDVRKLENTLQSCSVVSKEISKDLIYEVASAARPKEIKEVLELSINKNFIESKKLLLKTMLDHGLSGVDLIKQIQREILDLDVEDNKKLDMIEKCGEIEFRLVEGSDEYIQLEALLASFSK
jgi:replication factor C small subunit|tara:strand:- start:1092 stop:2024 length:933 start_codon:yes stop_codon:yes gene_type:complete